MFVLPIETPTNSKTRQFFSISYLKLYIFAYFFPFTSLELTTDKNTQNRTPRRVDFYSTFCDVCNCDTCAVNWSLEEESVFHPPRQKGVVVVVVLALSHVKLLSTHWPGGHGHADGDGDGFELTERTSVLSGK